jgi:hypothetical protein
LRNYISALNASTIDWQLIAFGNTRHAFTNPDAGQYGMSALAYNPSSDRRSWQYMQYFFKEIFKADRRAVRYLLPCYPKSMRSVTPFSFSIL